MLPLNRIATLPNGVERAIAAFSRTPDGGLIAVVSARGQLHRELIATLAVRHRLPIVYPDRFFVTSGGFFYGPDLVSSTGAGPVLRFCISPEHSIHYPIFAE
jgi:hypothetical protein